MILKGVAAIVLAAGRASRFEAGDDESKAIAELDGVPLVRRVAETVLASRATPVVVVTGHAADAVATALVGLDVRLVRNADHVEGMATSLQCGLAALPCDATGALVLLADMPLVTCETLDRLIDCFERQMTTTDAVVPLHQGTQGNPVLIGRSIFAVIAGLRGDEGARKVIGDPGRRVIACAVKDPGVLVDIDTRDALEALQRKI